ncbi:MAG: hypothetical protein RIM33_06750 [Alphaproteobacteria bacterium]
MELIVPAISAGTLTYESTSSSYPHFTLDVSSDELSTADGSLIYRLDDWRNVTEIVAGDWRGTASPHNGDLPQEPMRVGLSWTLTYEMDSTGASYTRDRDCIVEERGQITVAAGTFHNAWLIKCTLKRHDRRLPKYVETWFSSTGRILILRNETWGGSNPGSYRRELVGLSDDVLAIISGQ